MLSCSVLLQVVSNLLQVKQVVQQQMERLSAQRTGDLLSAAARGDTLRVRTMLEQRMLPDAKDYDGACGCRC